MCRARVGDSLAKGDVANATEGLPSPAEEQLSAAVRSCPYALKLTTLPPKGRLGAPLIR